MNGEAGGKGVVRDMNDYNRKFPDLDIDIRRVQKVELEILLEFDRVCKANNIKYHLFAGTLLGAIRHNGFIPWDDDIDVCMLREDYEKFLIVGKECLDGDYFLQTYETDENYINQFAKIRKNNTIFLQDDVVGTNIHQGFYIDIFPFDNVEPYTLVGRVQRNILNILRYMTKCRLKNKVNKTRNSFSRYFRLFIHYFIKIIPKKPMDKMITNIACMFNNKNTKYVGELSHGTAKYLYDRFTVEKNIFYDTIEWEFEGHKFPIPRKYDYVLTKNYGDYMIPPPLEQQKPHHGIIEICFDTTSKTEEV